MLALAALACVGVAACGSSSPTKSSSASAAGSATGANGASGANGGAGRFTAMRECLKKEGITLPARPKGGGEPRAFGPGGPYGGAGGASGASGPSGASGAQGRGRPFHRFLPPGVSATRFREALQKCGGGRFTPGAGRLSGTTVKTALEKFTACMRANGVSLAAPNTSGKGPVFKLSSAERTSAKFKAAEANCRGDLPAFFGGARPGAPPGGAGGNGSPPAPGT